MFAKNQEGRQIKLFRLTYSNSKSFYMFYCDKHNKYHTTSIIKPSFAQLTRILKSSSSFYLWCGEGRKPERLDSYGLTVTITLSKNIKISDKRLDKIKEVESTIRSARQSIEYIPRGLNKRLTSMLDELDYEIEKYQDNMQQTKDEMNAKRHEVYEMIGRLLK